MTNTVMNILLVIQLICLTSVAIVLSVIMIRMAWQDLGTPKWIKRIKAKRENKKLLKDAQLKHFNLLVDYKNALDEDNEEMANSLYAKILTVERDIKYYSRKA